MKDLSRCLLKDRVDEFDSWLLLALQPVSLSWHAHETIMPDRKIMFSEIVDHPQGKIVSRYCSSGIRHGIV